MAMRRMEGEERMRKRQSKAGRVLALAMLLAVTLIGPACSGAGPSPTAPTCDRVCQDAVAMRAFRETMKQVFNGALQNGPVGPQDQTYACSPFGGTAHITGTATSNANVGTTTVNLTYVFDHCRYIAADTEPTQNYDIAISGTAVEVGTIAVQPGTTTSLTMTSDAMTFAGTVYSPPLPFGSVADAAAPEPCALQLAQNGNQLSGTICGRVSGLTL